MDEVEQQQLEVLWPGGHSTIGRVDIGTGVEDLAGKTIAFVSDYAFRAEEMFALIEAELASRHHGMRFVPASTFGDVHGHNEPEVIAAMPGKLRAEKVDAVVVGVGA
ncbi:MAG: hypothetical protein QOH79_2173 [Acidimicrobiaceae bacterium]|jgi:hypothetical protein